MTEQACADRRLQYDPGSAGPDSLRYDVGESRHFQGDSAGSAAWQDVATLAASTSWEDRIRAEMARRHISITLPDQFPCLYETADSPNRAGLGHPRPHPWVISPDIDMLQRLLPDYQELWDSYTAQWGPKSRRVFAVGLLDGLQPSAVYRPGVTPEQVLERTMQLHSMGQCAPERILRLLPGYELRTRLPAVY